MNVDHKTYKGIGGLSLIPFVIFIGITIGSGLVLNAMGVESPFYQVKASVAVFIAIVVAFVMYKGTIEEKVDSFIKGTTDENISIMYMTCFLAGSFAMVAKASGGVDSVVNLGLSVIPPQYITAGLFLIASFMSLATGSSSGTTAALGTIAYTIAKAAGLNLPMVLAAVLGGAYFGDNLSIISDTTIVATRTQGVEMRDKFRMNFLMALPAAVIAAILYFIFGTPEQVVPINPDAWNFILVIPYIYVLVTSLIGMNVFLVLGSGTFVAGIAGMVVGNINLLEFLQATHAGFADMTEIVLLAIFIGGLSNMMRDQGGLDWLMNKVHGFIKSERTAQVGIAALVSVADFSIANNTAALIVTADIAREISDDYKVDPRRTASIMDVFCCVSQGLIPYGNQILLIGGLAMGEAAPIEILPYSWYIMFLGVFTIASIWIPYTDGVIKKNPWNWEYRMSENELADLRAKGIDVQPYDYSK